MKKSKILSLSLAIILCLVSLFGCDSPQRPNRDANNSNADGPVTVYAVDFNATEDFRTDQDAFSTEQHLLETYNTRTSSQQQLQIQYFPDIQAMNQQLSTERFWTPEYTTGKEPLSRSIIM